VVGGRSGIFISYSHQDEADPVRDPNGERWLSFVTSHLGPAQAHGHIEIWDDRRIEGGADWRAEIDRKLNKCAVCILLVSRHSLTSRFILDVEVKRILERRASEGIRFYPLVITSCDLQAANWLMNFNLRPRNGTAIELYSSAERNKIMADIAKEIRQITVADLSSVALVARDEKSDILVDVSRLPETPYKRLVGRDNELRILDDAFSETSLVNVVSLIAW